MSLRNPTSPSISRTASPKSFSEYCNGQCGSGWLFVARQRNFMTQIFRKILCPIDFDDNSIAALETACKVAAQNDASLCIMHVVEISAHATEMPPEGLKRWPIWEDGAER